MVEMTSQRVVRFLQAQMDKGAFQSVVHNNPKVRSLPEMIRRNGLLLTVVYLHGKADGDNPIGLSREGALLGLLWASGANARGENVSELPKNRKALSDVVTKWQRELVQAPISLQLLENERALVCATWISRMADAAGSSSEPIPTGAP